MSMPEIHLLREMLEQTLERLQPRAAPVPRRVRLRTRSWSKRGRRGPRRRRTLLPAFVAVSQRGRRRHARHLCELLGPPRQDARSCVMRTRARRCVRGVRRHRASRRESRGRGRRQDREAAGRPRLEDGQWAMCQVLRSTRQEGCGAQHDVPEPFRLFWGGEDERGRPAATVADRWARARALVLRH